ncbi:MAG: corrinoid protein [Nitrososphaerales archaeon]
MLEKIREDILNYRREETKKNVCKALNEGLLPSEILEKGLLGGLKAVIEEYNKDEIGLPEVVLATWTFREGMEVLEPFLKNLEKAKPKGIIVIGTVEGDIHDLGKNIIKTFLTVSGYEVYDLGVDVSAKEFVSKAKESNANIVAMSALMTTTMFNMEKVVEALKESGIRDKFKIIIGGGPTNLDFSKRIGADGYAREGKEAIEVVDKLMSEMRR